MKFREFFDHPRRVIKFMVISFFCSLVLRIASSALYGKVETPILLGLSETADYINILTALGAGYCMGTMVWLNRFVTTMENISKSSEPTKVNMSEILPSID